MYHDQAQYTICLGKICVRDQSPFLVRLKSVCNRCNRCLSVILSGHICRMGSTLCPVPYGSPLIIGFLLCLRPNCKCSWGSPRSTSTAAFRAVSSAPVIPKQASQLSQACSEFDPRLPHISSMGDCGSYSQCFTSALTPILPNMPLQV
jgi:hypothetical protein